MLTNWSTTEMRLHKFRDLRTEQKTGGLNRFLKRGATIAEPTTSLPTLTLLVHAAQGSHVVLSYTV